MSIQQQLTRFRSDLEKLRFTTQGNSGVRGVCSKFDILSGETILSAPSALHLSAESLKREKDDTIRLALLHVLVGSKGNEDEDADTDDDALAICLQILIGVSIEVMKKKQEKNKGEGGGGEAGDNRNNVVVDNFEDLSYWFSLFIHSLPPPSDFHLLPLLWPSHHLHALMDSSIVESVKEKKNWLRIKYDTLLNRLAEPSSLSSLVLVHLKEILTWKLFLWATCCVQSRCFISADHVLSVALIPFADLFNHNGADCNLSDTFVEERFRRVNTYEEGIGGGKGDGVVAGKKKSSRAYSFTLSARFDIKRGEELTISYGDRSGKDLLETFGFLPPVQKNPCDTVTLPIRKLLETKSYLDIHQHTISSSSSSPLLQELKDSLDIDSGVELCAGPLADDNIREEVEEDGMMEKIDDITTIETMWDFSGPSDDTSQFFRVLAWENSYSSDGDASLNPPPPLERFRRPISRENEIKSMEILTSQIAECISSIFNHKSQVKDKLCKMSAKDLTLFVTLALVDEENKATDAHLATLIKESSSSSTSSSKLEEKLKKEYGFEGEKDSTPVAINQEEEDIPIIKSLPLPCRNLLKSSMAFKEEVRGEEEEEEEIDEIKRMRVMTTSLYKRNRLRIFLVHLQHIARLFDIANGVTLQPVTPGARLLITSARQRAARCRFYKNFLSPSSSSSQIVKKFEFERITLNHDTVTVLLETRRRNADMLRSSSSSSIAVTTSSTPRVFDSTGLVNWPSARMLANLLVTRPILVRRCRNILELGSGAALLSSAIVAFLTKRDNVNNDNVNDDNCVVNVKDVKDDENFNKYITIVATDGCEDVLPLAQRNLNANNKSIYQSIENGEPSHHIQLVKSCPELLRWGNTTDEEKCLQHTLSSDLSSSSSILTSAFNLIVASECFYLQHGVSQDETGKGGVYTQALDFFNTALRLLSPCTCCTTPSPATSTLLSTTTTSSNHSVCCEAGILLVIYAPRYRGMGPQIKGAAAEVGLNCLALSTVGLISEHERSLHLCNDSRLLLLSKCLHAANAAMNDLGTVLGEPGFDDDHYPEWETSTLPPL
jgi:hypothetical protein